MIIKKLITNITVKDDEVQSMMDFFHKVIR